MSGFGDFEPDDAWSPGDADPLAVARILWTELYRRNPARFRAWGDHASAERMLIADAVAALLQRLRTEGTR